MSEIENLSDLSVSSCAVALPLPLLSGTVGNIEAATVLLDLSIIAGEWRFDEDSLIHTAFTISAIIAAQAVARQEGVLLNNGSAILQAAAVPVPCASCFVSNILAGAVSLGKTSRALWC